MPMFALGAMVAGGAMNAIGQEKALQARQAALDHAYSLINGAEIANVQDLGKSAGLEGNSAMADQENAQAKARGKRTATGAQAAAAADPRSAGQTSAALTDQSNEQGLFQDTSRAQVATQNAFNDAHLPVLWGQQRIATDAKTALPLQLEQAGQEGKWLRVGGSLLGAGGSAGLQASAFSGPSSNGSIASGSSPGNPYDQNHLQQGP